MTAPTIAQRRQQRPAQINFPESNIEHDPNWRTRALCRDFVDDSVWCPEEPGQSRFAKAICNGNLGGPACPVRDQCLASALSRKEKFGVWGGMDQWERARLLASRTG